jgi:hypothetical protein
MEMDYLGDGKGQNLIILPNPSNRILGNFEGGKTQGTNPNIYAQKFYLQPLIKLPSENFFRAKGNSVNSNYQSFIFAFDYLIDAIDVYSVNSYKLYSDIMPINVDPSSVSNSSTTYVKGTVNLSAANTPVLISAADPVRKGFSCLTKSPGTWYFGYNASTSVSNYVYKATAINTLIEFSPSSYTGDIYAVCSVAGAAVDTFTFTA